MYLSHWLQRILAENFFSAAPKRRVTSRHRQRAFAQGSRRLECLETRSVLTSDFGDAPDTSAGTGLGDYQTLAERGGPSHVIDATQTKLYLGARVDGSANGNPTDRAHGDDLALSSPDDEDGVLEPAQDLLLTVGTAPVVRVRATNTTGTTAKLYGWIDFNRDGIFDNNLERGSVTVPNGTSKGVLSLQFPEISLSVLPGATMSRFRISSDAAAANSTGIAQGGEVEDYPVTITDRSDGLTGNRWMNARNGLSTTSKSSVATTKNFGRSVVTLGDLNGDGITDIAVGAGGNYNQTGNRGQVFVQFLNSNGSVKNTTQIGDGLNGGPSLASNNRFGSALSAIGDLDGDGIVDLVAGAEGDDTGGTDRGAVYVLFLNSNGTAKRTVKLASGTSGVPSLPDGTGFGDSLTAVSDMDGDGVTDLAVGAEESVFLLSMNSNGTARSSIKLASGQNGVPTIRSGVDFGVAVASLGDLDGDGRTDLAVGARQAGLLVSGRYPQQGSVFVLKLNSNGTVKSSTEVTSGTNGGPSLGSSDYFGSSVAAMGDLDGDGIRDLAVGAPGDDIAGTDRGAVHVLFLNADGSVKNRNKIERSGGGERLLANGDAFGTSLAFLGDLSGEGVPDLAVGDRESVHILHLRQLTDGSNDPPSVPAPSLNDPARHGATGPQLGARRGIVDGVTFGALRVGRFGAGSTVRVQNAPNGAKLDAWIDFNGDGAFGGAEDLIADSITVSNGANQVAFDVPASAASGITKARFRISSAGNLGILAPASDGESEDYTITIDPPEDATGIFNSHYIIVDEPFFAEHVVAADMDQDGDLDALFTNGVLFWQENDGTPFSGAWPNHRIGLTRGDGDVSTADVDGDGDLDVLVGADNFLAWYENEDGLDREWNWHTISEGPFEKASTSAADVDGDGDIDVVASLPLDHGAQRIAWYENDGTPAQDHWIGHTIRYVFTGMTLLSPVDMDNDGDVDLVAAAYNDTKLAWYENDGTPRGEGWIPHVISNETYRPTDLAAADMDADGDFDIVLNGDGLNWYENDGTSANGGWTPHRIVSRGGQFRVADIDGDGDPDVLAGQDPVTWYENDGTARNEGWVAHENDRGVSDVVAVSTADIDGDGDVDALLKFRRSGGFVLLENDDKSRPLASFERAGLFTNPTNSDVVVFIVTFSEAVVGVDLADFKVSGSSTASVSGLSGIGDRYQVTVRGGDLDTYSGPLGLDFTASVTITDGAGNTVPRSEPVIDQVFTIDNKAPRVDIVDITPDPRETSAGVVSVIFNEPVTGVDISDFTLSRDGKLVDVSNVVVAGSGASYALDLSAVTANVGSYVLQLNSDQSNILDIAGNLLASTARDAWVRSAPRVGLRTDKSSIAEAGAATITAVLTSVQSSDVTVTLGVDIGQLSSSDYALSSTLIVISAGNLSGSTKLTAIQDAIDEPSEMAAIEIVSVVNATEDGEQRLSIGIEDDDPSSILVTRGNGILTIADKSGIATNTRISLDTAASRIVVESLTDGVVASVVRSPVDGLRGIVVNLGAESDRLNASGITVPMTVNGGAGNDTIIGGEWIDLLMGDAGADSIKGGGGSDTLSGGTGDDILDGGSSTDLLMEVGDVNYVLTPTSLTGLGTDQLTGFEAANLTGGNAGNLIDASAFGFPVGINGGMGADTLLGAGFADTLNGGTGDDVLNGFGGRDLLMGGAGNDVLDGGASEDTLDGGAGIDTARRRNDLNFVVTSSALIELMGESIISTDRLAGIEAAFITGGPSANRIDLSGLGEAGSSTIQGGGGNDTIVGSDGADAITTADGADVIDARRGNDVVRSGGGADSIIGGVGNDLLDGEAGADTIAGDAGNDVISGGEGNDSLTGGAGMDTISSVSGADVASGGEGDDQLLGGLGSETLLGDAGNDRLFGMGGSDFLDGGADADSLQGGEGTDTLLGGVGDDQLSGGAAVDSIDGGAGTNRLQETVDGTVVVVGATLVSAGIGNESLLNIGRIMLSGGGSNDLFDARRATVPVQLQGGAGNDTLLGGLGGDAISGGDGNDVISGGAGIDQLSGGSGLDDWLEQADSNFTVNGVTVTSAVTGSERVTDIERIVLIGGDRANTLNASGAGVPVVLIGGRGNDTLLGGGMADTLSGGNRNDSTIAGSDGGDSLAGGAGADTLEADSADRRTLGAGDAVVADVFALLPAWIDAL